LMTVSLASACSESLVVPSSPHIESHIYPPGTSLFSIKFYLLCLLLLIFLTLTLHL
jgi:hypothetical protein